MRVTFESVRSDYSTDPANLDRVTIGRLVMPIGAAEQMAKTILEQVERLKASEEAEQNTILQ